MPVIKIDHIVSFSSEDPVHTANNILSTDTNKKWKCQIPGEKQAVVVLQLEKATQITAIDIGNEHSAYVEILVSRSSSNDDFKVLLVTSAFMSPLEARQSQNVNKVRMFTQEHLSKPECHEKWDRIKIVCTQPFNKHVKFGLSFIKFHSNESKVAETMGPTTVGKFLLRPESPDNLVAGTLFAKRKEITQDEKPTAAAAIRDAASSSSLALYGSPLCKPKLKDREFNSTPKRSSSTNTEDSTPKNRNRNELFYTKEDEESNEKIDKLMKKKYEEDQLKQKEEEIKQHKRKKLFDAGDTPTKKKKKSDDENESKEEEKRPNLFNLLDTTKKRKDSPHKKHTDTPSYVKNKNTKNDSKVKKNETSADKKVKMTKLFNKLLDGVFLVISGIQNPERADLRGMALSMGAKYKTDWDATCTHLICAFPNTPKFNQVQGKGKIVKKAWVEQCYSQRKRFPWRRFALDKNDLSQPESEDEIDELIDIPVMKQTISKLSMTDSDSEIPSTSTKSAYQSVDSSDNEQKADGSDTEERVARILEQQKRKNMQLKNLDENIQDTNIDDASNSKKTEKNRKNRKNGKKRNDNNESSTEEELDSVQSSTYLKNSSSKESVDIFGADTDDEPDLNIKTFNNMTPDIFHGDKFYVDHTFDEETYNTLCKYIIAYNGKCIDETNNVNIIVTTKENSSVMKEINQEAKCVKHSWILQCHSKQKMLPVRDFIF